MESFGEYIRAVRTEKEILLREAAAALGIDPSLLSRIEHGEKRATREQVGKLARILGIGDELLMIHYLSDRVVYELKDEKLAMKAMEVAEQKIAYILKSKKSRSK